MLPASFAFLGALLHALLPASVSLLNQSQYPSSSSSSSSSGDSRVVVCSVLRRMVPAVLQGCVRWAEALGAQGKCVVSLCCVCVEIYAIMCWIVFFVACDCFVS